MFSIASFVHSLVMLLLVIAVLLFIIDNLYLYIKLHRCTEKCNIP